MRVAALFADNRPPGYCLDTQNTLLCAPKLQPTYKHPQKLTQFYLTTHGRRTPDSLYLRIYLKSLPFPENLGSMSTSADVHVNGNGKPDHDHILRPRAVKLGNPAVVRAMSEEGLLAPNGTKDLPGTGVTTGQTR